MPRRKQIVAQKTALTTKIAIGISGLAILGALAVIGVQMNNKIFRQPAIGRIIRTTNCDIITAEYCCLLENEYGLATPMGIVSSTTAYTAANGRDRIIETRCRCDKELPCELMAR